MFLTAVWIVYLLLPLHLLQQFHVSIGGWTVPIYYFFVVPPVLCLVLYAILSKRGWTPVEAAWWLWPFVLLGSIVFSLFPAWSLREAMSWMLRGFSIGGMYLLWVSDSPLRAVRWVYAAAVLAALGGLLELGFNRNPLADRFVGQSVAPIPETGNPLYRPYRPGAGLPLVSPRPRGTQGNRIPYAASLLPFFSLALFFCGRDGRWRWAHRLAALILLSLLLAAGSLSVLIGLTVLLFVYGITIGIGRTLLIAGFFSIVAIGGLWFFTAHAASGWQSLPLKQTSVRHRLESYRTVGALKGRSMFGAGYGQYPNVYLAYYKGPLEHLPTPDNQYLRWLIETGIWGFTALIGFISWLIRAGQTRLKDRNDLDEARVYNAFLAGWAGIATSFIFFDGFYWGACNMTFWSFLGLWATCLKPRPDALS